MKSGLNQKWLVCRICLKQPKEDMQTIFDKNAERDLTRMILECGGVPVSNMINHSNRFLDYVYILHFLFPSSLDKTIWSLPRQDMWQVS